MSARKHRPHRPFMAREINVARELRALHYSWNEIARRLGRARSTLYSHMDKIEGSR